MKIDIYNVNHGQCAVITAPNGRRLMIDCGDRLERDRWWAPSLEFCSQTIELLALMNLDEDHLSNFPLTQRYVQVGQILTNPTVGAAVLLALKRDGMGTGTKAVYHWLNNPFKAPPRPAPDFGAVRVWWYWNPYIPGVSTGTNNLSLVLFVQYGGFRIAFTGDMEAAGWRELLLRYPGLAQDLRGTCIFVAPHHGRVSGCSEEVFAVCRPELVIMSDAARQYETQDTDGWYRARCSGAIVIADPSQRRYVATTRKDGDMHIDVFPDASWIWRPVSVREWDLRQPETRPALAAVHF